VAEDNVDEPPVQPHVHPATLRAFEEVVMEGLEKLQEQEQEELAHQKEEMAYQQEQETRKMNKRDTLDMCMVVLGFVITAVLIWAHWQNWAPETGPLPIAGVAIRRVFRL
jgi:hypothetical protein